MMCLIELGYDLCDRVATLPVDATAEQVNTYTLSILAIVSGLFTEQAYISLKMISQRLTIRPPKENSE